MAYKFRLPVKSDQLQAIGMVAAEWSYFEAVLQALIWRLLLTPDDATGQAVTTHISLPNRLDILTTLMDLRGTSDADMKQLRKWCDHVRKTLAVKRNSVVHAQWVAGDGGSPEILAIKARGRLTTDQSPKPAGDIVAIAADIEAFTNKFTEFFEERGISVIS